MQSRPLSVGKILFEDNSLRAEKTTKKLRNDDNAIIVIVINGG